MARSLPSVIQERFVSALHGLAAKTPLCIQHTVAEIAIAVIEAVEAVQSQITAGAAVFVTETFKKVTSHQLHIKDGMKRFPVKGENETCTLMGACRFEIQAKMLDFACGHQSLFPKEELYRLKAWSAFRKGTGQLSYYCKVVMRAGRYYYLGEGSPTGSRVARTMICFGKKFPVDMARAVTLLDPLFPGIAASWEADFKDPARIFATAKTKRDMEKAWKLFGATCALEEISRTGQTGYVMAFDGIVDGCGRLSWYTGCARGLKMTGMTGPQEGDVYLTLLKGAESRCPHLSSIIGWTRDFAKRYGTPIFYGSSAKGVHLTAMGYDIPEDGEVTLNKGETYFPLFSGERGDVITPEGMAWLQAKQGDTEEPWCSMALEDALPVAWQVAEAFVASFRESFPEIARAISGMYRARELAQLRGEFLGFTQDGVRVVHVKARHDIEGARHKIKLVQPTGKILYSCFFVPTLFQPSILPVATQSDEGRNMARAQFLAHGAWGTSCVMGIHDSLGVPLAYAGDIQGIYSQASHDTMGHNWLWDILVAEGLECEADRPGGDKQLLLLGQHLKP